MALRLLLSFFSLWLHSVTPLLTFSLPQFYKSLGTVEDVLPFRALGSMSNQLRKAASVLVGILAVALFNSSAQDNTTFWFLVSSSLTLAVMGMVCSTVLIVFPYSHLGLPTDVAMLNFLGCTVWDLFSLPAICVVWSSITFSIALITDVVRSIVFGNGTVNIGKNARSRFMAAKITLLLVIFFAALRFGLFMLHIRRLFYALGGTIKG